MYPGDVVRIGFARRLEDVHGSVLVAGGGGCVVPPMADVDFLEDDPSPK